MSHTIELRHEDGAAPRRGLRIDRPGRVYCRYPAGADRRCQSGGLSDARQLAVGLDRPSLGQAWPSRFRQVRCAASEPPEIATSCWPRVRPNGSRRDPLTGLHSRDAVVRPSLRRWPGRACRTGLAVHQSRQFQTGERHLGARRRRSGVASRRRAARRVHPAGRSFGALRRRRVCRAGRRRARRGDLKRLARRIQRAVQVPTSIAGRECNISASVGIARRTARGEAIEELIIQADRDMYRAKRLSRGRATQIFPAAS